jgi:hypothetical protein
LEGWNEGKRDNTAFFLYNRYHGKWEISIYGGENIMNTEKEYMEIGKAIIDECMQRGDERRIRIIIRSVQYGEKFYIMMEDSAEPLSVWKYSDLEAVRGANRQQGARERAEELAKKIRDEPVPEELPLIGMVAI